MRVSTGVRRWYQLGLRAALCLAAAATAGAASDPPALNITRISIADSQILIEFNRAVVPLGRMERKAEELPITIAPQVNCHWRWISTQALACNLDAKDYLKPAHEYVVTVAPGIRALDGATTSETMSRKRVTQLPEVSRARIETWVHPRVPVFRVRFNQPVTGKSVAASLYIEAYGVQEPVSVTARPDPYDSRQPLYVAATSATDLSERSADATGGQEARWTWLVQAAMELPESSRARLHAEAGLVSALGPLPGTGRRNLASAVTFGEFRFLGVSCSSNYARTIRIEADGSASYSWDGWRPATKEQARCNPLSRVSLMFSAPVLTAEIARELVLEPNLAGSREDYDPWAQVRDYSSLGYTDGSRSFHVSLPEYLKAAQEYRVRNRATSDPENSAETPLLDYFGRQLAEPFDLSFETDHRLPHFRLKYQDAVLESGVDSEYPLYVTNLEEVRLNYRRLNEDGARGGLTHTFALPPVKDISFAVPLGVREMTEGKSAAVLGGISTVPAVGYGSSRDFAYLAQVTPYQVHVKAGHYNTLVWVTSLRTGKPVRGAEITVFRSSVRALFGYGWPAPQRVGQPVRTDWRGVGLLPGTQSLDPGLDSFSWCSRGSPNCPRIVVRVSGREGMALLPLEHAYRAYTGAASRRQISSRQRKRYGHIRAWGTTAQGVYRAGDTIQYKFYVRDQDARTLVARNAGSYTLKIEDPGGKTVHEAKNIRLNDFGAWHGEYTVGATSLMGWYRFVLSADYTSQEWQPMRVLVTDFTPAPFRVGNSLNGDLFGPGDKLIVDTSAALHSGGAYVQSEARVVVDLRRRPFSSSHPAAAGFRFDTPQAPDKLFVHEERGDLSDTGTHSASVELRESKIIYGRLRAESSVRDDRGKHVSAASHADYAARDRLVGLRKDRWVFQQNQAAEVSYIVVDEHGAPVNDTHVELQLEWQERKVARVKGAGNAYLPRFSTEWVAEGECSGTPGGEPLICSFRPARTGAYRVTAAIRDTRGRVHGTEMPLWVIGEGRVVWDERPGYGMELMSQATEYKVGDKARYLVKNPLPGATALVSVERFGVIDQWQVKLKGSTPIIEFPVKPDYVPGAYLSVVAVSPRVESPPPDSHQGLDYVDLGKPAFRMGYARVPVVDPYKQLEVEVQTDRSVYKPREKVSVKLEARPRHGRRRPVEFAVAVLDEAVFDLIAQGRDYFDPYKGFYWLDSPDVENYSLLMQIIGRQKFEKKGANAGGDGGGGPDMRMLFKYVAHWEPSLPADRQGKARFEFELPENLTGWRVLAMAVTPSDQLGLGDTVFKTNLPTEIRPVMPNQVTEGDAFAAGFSVMNRTGQARSIDVVIKAEGDIADGPEALLESTLALGPYRRETVYLPLRAARIRTLRDLPAGQVRFRAQAMDATDGDALGHELPVLKSRDFEIAAQYGSVTDQPAIEEVLFPEKIYADAGDVSVVFSPTVIGNLEGAFRYMRDYPYSCWEQKLSKALLAAQFAALRQRMDHSLQWSTSDGLPTRTLQEAANHQAPNGGMAYWLAVDQRASPYLSAYTALGFAWLREAGYKVPALVEERLHDYLRHMLRRDVMPDYFSRGMSSSVRAVALSALARAGKLNPDELTRYAAHAEYMSLFGKAHFIDAALRVSGAEDLARSAMTDVLDSSVASGGKRLFNESLDSGYARILSTPLRANCALLSAFAQVENPAEHGLSETMASGLVRALTQSRGSREHWENTQENVFCMNALLDYARRWEAVEPNMRASASLDEQSIGEARFADFRDPAVTLSLPIAAEHPGKDAQIRIRRDGNGRLYYAARVRYAPLEEDRDRVHAGIDLRREYSVRREGEWRLLDKGEAIRRGELVRVDLFVNLPTARNFVVVDDPIPGGLEPVNRDLATASGVDAEQGDYKASGGSWWYDFNDWVYFGGQRWSFYHREMRHDAVRFYSDYLPPGRYHLSYTAQAIANGDFRVRPAHAGEMYDIDIYGKTKAMRLEVVDP